MRAIFRTLIYSELWHIKNPWFIQTSTMMKHFVKINNRKQFSSIRLPHSLLYEINTMRSLLQRQLFYIRNLYSNKLLYLQLIAALVYRNNFLRSHKQCYLNFQRKPWKIRLNEFIFRTCNFTKDELFLSYFSRYQVIFIFIFIFLCKRLRGLLLPQNFHAFTESVVYLQ